ncbi:hypothetical protein [Paenibacillus camelliae]|uniref:hypothetical protein n=1 Tax=Paenibacillus camelliae TaxID=512410 RepID=UPI00203E0572|nr:hypothetical protein [Paenibacillus camelliae]
MMTLEVKANMIWVIVIVVLLLIVIGAFTSESPGCGTCLLLVLIIFVLWRLGAGAFLWNILRYLYQELSKLLA